MSRPRSELRYAPYYCEENVWHLTTEPTLCTGPAEVIFISNPGRACALWDQRAAERDSYPVFWDYHVILVCRHDTGAEVWDLDTTLGLPVALGEYLGSTFRVLPDELSQLSPRFRVLEAELYRQAFCSDREHMRAADGGWLHPPPPWPAICPPGARSFWRWTEMSADDPDILDLEQLAIRYGIG